MRWSMDRVCQILHPRELPEDPNIGKELTACTQSLGVQVPAAPAGREAEHLHPNTKEHSPHLLLIHFANHLYELLF
jgi:hypothetical protein